ncbi:MAG: PAS domain S-box protein [Pseudomonadota bacterium]
MIEPIPALRRNVMLAALASLLVPALLIGGLLWFKGYQDEIRKGTLELLQQNSELLSGAMQDPLWNINPDSASDLLDAIMASNQDLIRIDVRDGADDPFISRQRAERRPGFTASTRKPVSYRGAQIGSVELEMGSARLHRKALGQLSEYAAALAVQTGLSVLLVFLLLQKIVFRPRPGLAAEPDRVCDAIEETTQVPARAAGKIQQIEKKSVEREARYRTLLDQSPIAIIEWDTNCRVIEWNAAAEQIFGHTRQQAIGKHARFLVPQSEHERVGTLFRALAEGTGGTRSVNHNLRADGKIIICQWRNTTIADRAGRTDHLLSMGEDITEQRRAEEARSLSEAKFAGAFQCNPDSASIVRISDGMILDVNQTFEDLTGFSREESVGKTALALNLWVDPAQQAVLYQQLRTDKLVRDFSWSMRTRLGAIRLCKTNGTLFSIGPEWYILTVVQDITDQRHLEEQKAEAERALMRLAQGTQDMSGESFFELLVADLASALRMDRAFISLCAPLVSDQMRTLAAYVNGRITRNFEYEIAASPSESVLAGEIIVFQTGIQALFPEDRSLAEQGWDSFGGAPIRDAAGNTIGVLAVMHSLPLANPDLVRSLLQVFSERASAELERKRAAEALRNSEQRFSTIFHSSPVAMSVFRAGSGSSIVDLNKAFERLFMLQRESVVGKNELELSIYVHDRERRAVNKAINAKGTLNRYEAWMRKGDGSEALFMLSGNTFDLTGEKFVIFTWEDITEKHEIEKVILELNENLEDRVTERTEELQQANQELESTLETLNMAQEELVRSEKLAALGALVAGVAHELNTPIGNSLMVASTLIDRTRQLASNFNSGLKRSALESYIDDACKAGDILERNLYRAANLVSSFKQVAVDQTSSQRREFSLAEVVSEIMLTLSPAITKTAFKVMQTISDDIAMDSYPGPLGQVLTNLINNALLHGFEGRTSGTVAIEAQVATEGWLELTIRDDGIGIAPENLNRVFDPFFTTKLGAGGSGLGLPITHNIVTSILGGKIRMQSEVNAGTRFVLLLPLVAPQIQADE